MEHLLSVHREEAALQLSQEDLAAILETLRTKKLINVSKTFDTLYFT